MGKEKMTLLDVRAIVKELRAKLIGHRVANIYNLSTKSFLIKLAGSTKLFLLLESGVRLHTTAYTRDKDNTPSGFAAKLRKHLKLSRLENITQVGADRVVDFQFGSGEKAHHLILELYAQGNVILTDAKYEMLLVLRKFTYEAKEGQTDEAKVNVHEVYPLAHAREADVPLDVPTLEAIIKKLNEAALAPKAEAKGGKKGGLGKDGKPVTAAAAAAATTTDDATPAAAADGEEKEGGGDGDEAAAPAAAAGDDDESRLSQQQKSKKQKGGKGGKEARRLEKAAEDRAAAKEDKKPKILKGKAGLEAGSLKTVLANALQLSPEILSDCLLRAGIEPTATLASTRNLEGKLDAVVAAYQESSRLFAEVATKPMKGYIVARDKAPAKTAAVTVITPATPVKKDGDAPAATPAATEEKKEDGVVETYDEFLPMLNMQHSPDRPGVYNRSQCKMKEYPDFDAALDEFFSKLESQKQEVRLIKDKQAAWKKVETVREHLITQQSSMEQAQKLSIRKARLVEHNKVQVDAALNAVNTEIAKGTDWRDLDKLIKDQKKLGNPVAKLITKLSLDQNKITVQLEDKLAPGEDSDESDDDDGDNSDAEGDEDEKKTEKKAKAVKPPVKIDLDLTLTAQKNAQLYYDARKKTAVKHLKTIEASAKALKAAERKTVRALKEVDVKAKISKIRKVHWFEKFHWFISSENYLVIGGRDSQQNEAIVRKQLHKNDVYVHTEAPGSPSVIIKNPSGGAIPPLTLVQAGVMTICRSSAWKSKVMVRAYWVYPDQVTKTAPTGQFLVQGSFMIRGKKNFIPEAPLVMGLGLMWRLDDTCIARHVGERKIRSLDDTAAVLNAADNREDGPKRRAAPGTKKGDDDNAAAAAAAESDDDDDIDVTSKLVLGGATATATAATTTVKPKTSAASAAAAATAGPVAVADRKAHTEDENDTKASAAAAAATAAASRARPSARDRKLLKAGKPIPAPNATIMEDTTSSTYVSSDASVSVAPSKAPSKKPAKKAAGDGDDSESDDDTTSTTTGGAANKPNMPKKRGARTKARRVKDKYAEQDEEDKAIATQLLGLQAAGAAAKKKDDKKKEAEAKKESGKKETGKKDGGKPAKKDGKNGGGKKDDATTPSKKAGTTIATITPNSPPVIVGDATTATPTDGTTPPAAAAAAVVDNGKTCFHCKQSGHVFKTCPLRAASGGADDKKSVRQKAKEVMDEENDEIKKLAKEEKLDEEDGDGAIAGELDSLTARPTDEDIVQYAVPMCAPLAALTDFKFRLKLVPGDQKKGRTSKAATDAFSYTADVTPEEKELIKGIADTEYALCLVSGVKIVLGSATAGKKKGGGGRGGGNKKKKNKPKAKDE